MSQNARPVGKVEGGHPLQRLRAARARQSCGIFAAMIDLRPVARAPSMTALFRFSVLSQVEALVKLEFPRGRAARIVAARDHDHPVHGSTRVRLRTLQRWRMAYERDGFAGLEPKDRGRTTTSVALSPELIAFFAVLIVISLPPDLGRPRGPIKGAAAAYL